MQNTTEEAIFPSLQQQQQQQQFISYLYTYKV